MAVVGSPYAWGWAMGHRLEVRKDGFATVAKDVTVEPGQVVTVDARLKSL